MSDYQKQLDACDDFWEKFIKHRVNDIKNEGSWHSPQANGCVRERTFNYTEKAVLRGERDMEKCPDCEGKGLKPGRWPDEPRSCWS